MRRRAFALFLVLLTLFACFAPQASAAPSDWDENNPGALLPTHLYAQTAVLIDAETGDVLFDKDSLVRMYPASTTKIMTLLLAVESDIPLDEEITIPDRGGKRALRQLQGARLRRRAHEFSGPSLRHHAALVQRRRQRHRLSGGRQHRRIRNDDERPRRRDRPARARTLPTPTAITTRRTIPPPTTSPSSRRRPCKTRPSPDRLHPPPTSWRPLKIAGPTTSPTPLRWSTRTARITTRAASASRRATTAAPASASSARSTARAYPSSAWVLDAGRESNEPTKKWEDTRKLFDYGLVQYHPYTLTDLFDASGRNINTVDHPPTPPRTTPRRACWSCG